MPHLSPPDSEQARRGSREPLRKGDWEPRWDREGVSLHHRLGAASCPSRFPALRQTGTASGGSPVPAERIWLLPPPSPRPRPQSHCGGLLLGASPPGCPTDSSAPHGDTEQVTCCSGLGPTFPKVTTVSPTQDLPCRTLRAPSPHLTVSSPWSPARQACPFSGHQLCGCRLTPLPRGLSSVHGLVRAEQRLNSGAGMRQGQPPMPPMLLWPHFESPGRVPCTTWHLPLASASAATHPPWAVSPIPPIPREGSSGLHFLSSLAFSPFRTSPRVPSRSHMCRCRSPPPTSH